MPGYVITSVFEVGDGKPPLGPGVLERAWGRGHRFSYCDGRMLTLVVEFTAVDQRLAFEFLLTRAETVWRSVAHGALGRAVTLRVQGAVDEKVAAGAPAGADGGKRRKRARVLRYFDGPVGEDQQVQVTRGLPDDPPDGGGLAGVREPRRPRPGPPGLGAARALPGSGPVASPLSPPDGPARSDVVER